MVTAKSAGSGIGAFFNNPGVVAIALIGAGLFIFRKPISEAVQSLTSGIGGLFSTSGPIFGAGQEAGQFVFNIGQEVGGSVFDAGAAAGQSVFDAGKAFGDFVGSTQQSIDQQLQNFFKTFPSDVSIGAQNVVQDVSDSALKAAEEGGPLTGLFDFFGGLFGPENIPPEFQGPAIFPQTGESTLLDPDRPLDLFQFAEQFGIQPTEAFKIEKQFGGLDFEAIAAIPTFGEVLAENPELTASQIANLKFIQAGGVSPGFDFGTNTGLALELAGANFGSDVFLQKEDPSFALLLEAQNLISIANLGGFVGGDLFGNPDFPITAGEAFLGEAGTIVSPSISNLNEQQLKDFIEQFG